jgi:S1-C subfamily serine protease
MSLQVQSQHELGVVAINMKYPLTCLEGNNNLALVSAPLSPFANDTALGSGTGFFFQPVFGRTFLVTNRHIVIEESDRFFPDHLVLRMHTDAFHLEKSEDFVIPLYSTNSERKPTWLELDSTVDIIALELDPAVLKNFVFHAFRPIDLISPDIIVGVGDPLLVIGYPRGFSDSTHNLPVFRQASVASVYPIPFQGNPFFLIDSELHPGTSGSPVITRPSLWIVKKDEAELFETPEYRLVGIHSATYDDLKLNVVWFADLLMEIFQKAPLMHQGIS